MTDLVNVTIDGVAIAVPKGTTIIEAAKQAGVLVPHYCYHPSLPSPAVCRMCLVDVEKAPKLMPACVTTVAEGNVINVNNEKSKKARESVLEFLLINHPLDCPICDQAGECELQNYVFQEGRAETRYADYAKRFNPVEDFGPDILYVPNRCILCTRCVRFMENVADEPVLNVSERGDRAYIGIDPAHELTHPWSGNVVDLCPVGSLISKDFLHKARAWDLDKTASICPGCTQGCNIMIDTRDDIVVRLRPRANLEVNRHFICDTGRADYRWMNRGDRIEAPLTRRSALGTRHSAVGWDEALGEFAEYVVAAKSVVILASGRASTESLGWVRRLVDGSPKVVAAVKVPTGPEAALAGIPNLALRAERVPNLHGAQLTGYSTEWTAAVAASKTADLTIVLDAELTDPEVAALGAKTVVIGTVDDERFPGVALVLPTTNLAEENGSYVNRDHRAQRYFQAKSAPGMARPAWWIATEAIQIISGVTSPATAAEAFAALGRSVPALAGLTYSELGHTGRAISPAAAGAAR